MNRTVGLFIIHRPLFTFVCDNHHFAVLGEVNHVWQVSWSNLIKLCGSLTSRSMG